MKQKIDSIIKSLIDNHDLSNLAIPSDFSKGHGQDAAIAKNLNLAFLITLSGSTHPLYKGALDYAHRFESDPLWGKAIQFYKDGIARIHEEIAARCAEDRIFEKNLEALYSCITAEKKAARHEIKEHLFNVFFPEAAGVCGNHDDKIKSLREKRKITIRKLNSHPIHDPAHDILFTSNILITIPPPSQEIDSLHISTDLKQELKQIVLEEQAYWYDHPVPIGIAPEHNEILYGLEGLDTAVAFEKKRGTISKDAKVSCVLSVSVTHKGLQKIVKRYLEDELKQEKNIRHLNVYVFTEEDTSKLIKHILEPLKGNTAYTQESGRLYEVFGVDGEYGRHYSFLKAISAFWQVFVDPHIKGTFKIDLDQVFPQKELVQQSGLSAFEHFKTPLWGAEGIDSAGHDVDLGMIAGALVNQRDIDGSLYSPDVSFPDHQIRADELIFFSALPQALSTEAEMMTRYEKGDIDGKRHCIQRIHVTGGTNGILVNALRKYRPFTPTFIGRAEDQAYILSVLHDGDRAKLRYAHKDGLIMRHDKEAFAVEAIKMAAAGKIVGDYVRTLMFSYYIKALPWSLNDIKNDIDPFTGCFVSKIPITVVCLRFALKLGTIFSQDTEEASVQGLELFKVGTARLHDTIKKLTESPNPLFAQFKNEKAGWNMFYDILDSAEEKIHNNDKHTVAIKEKAGSLVDSCRIQF